MAPDTISRFWDKVTKTDTCWLWTGSSRASHGRPDVRYGTFWLPDLGNKAPAHRVAWFLTYGSWPTNVLDHRVCDNTLCVRPDHLRDVTHGENIARGNSPSAVAARTGVCQNGHTDGWYVIKATGKRRCRTCVNDRMRRRRAERRLVG